MLQNVTEETPGPLAVQASIHSMHFAASNGETSLIEDLNIKAEAGEIHALLGPTGAGKTTLLRVVAGLEHGYEGQVTVGSRPVTAPSHRVQLMFQDHRLLPWLRVSDNIAFGLREFDERVVEEWLRIVQLTDRRDAWPKTLSGGESSRVALARAFVSRPSVLLLDEPFVALDAIVRVEIQDRLLDALSRSPATVLMVSHSVEDAVMLADVIHVLETRPMRVAWSLRLPQLRPRRRGEVALLQVAAEVYDALGAAWRNGRRPRERT